MHLWANIKLVSKNCLECVAPGRTYIRVVEYFAMLRHCRFVLEFREDNDFQGAEWSDDGFFWQFLSKSKHSFTQGYLLHKRYR